MNERTIDKKTVAVNIYLELIAKVVKAYRREGDPGGGQAFIRALEHATKDVQLTVDEHREIARKRAENYQRRIEERAKKRK